MRQTTGAQKDYQDHLPLRGQASIKICTAPSPLSREICCFHLSTTKDPKKPIDQKISNSSPAPSVKEKWLCVKIHRLLVAFGAFERLPLVVFSKGSKWAFTSVAGVDPWFHGWLLLQSLSNIIGVVNWEMKASPRRRPVGNSQKNKDLETSLENPEKKN